MKLGVAIYTVFLFYNGVDLNNIPDTCSDMRHDQRVIADAQRLTGVQDPKADEYIQLVQAKKDIFKCDEKNNDDNPKYLRRKKTWNDHKNAWRDSQISTYFDYLKIEHCPEILAFTTNTCKHRQANLAAIESTLCKNIQDQSNRYECNTLHHTHNKHHHLYKNLKIKEDKS